MLRLLILDPDEENIRNFKTYLRMSFPMFRNVNTASGQGRDIMDLIKETSPELIIMDISFFGPSAYKTMGLICERYPDIKFIVYGTINDSEYIKKVMEYGVIDYMYRPVKPAEFKQCMERAIAFFDKYYEQKRQEQKTVEKYKQKLYLYENIFLTALVRGHITNEAEITRSFKYFNMRFTGGYTVFIIRIDHFKKIILTLEEQEKHLKAFRICELANMKFESLGWIGRAFVTEFNCVTCLVAGLHDLTKLVSVCGEIKDDIFFGTKTRVTVGLGRSYMNGEDIHISYNEADAALRYRFYLGHNTVIPIHFVDPNNNITYRYPALKEDRLVYTAVSGEYDYCKALVTDIFDILKKSGALPDKLIPKIVTYIMISISRYASEQGILPDAQVSSFFSISDALNLKTPDQAAEYLKTALKGFCDAIMIKRAVLNHTILEKARAYVGEHYHEGMQLSTAALELETTPEHLNGLFIAEGMTFAGYVGQVRISEAKRLIKETDLTDEQVALKVGYDDIRHFRGLFKQQTGIFPHDYRNMERGRV